MKTNKRDRIANLAGMSLIEMVGVLAAVSFLITIGAKTTLESIANAEEEAEAKSLESIASAFREYVRDQREIPGVDDWATTLSVGLALSPFETERNGVGNARKMLVDPDFWSAGENTLPYVQDVNGCDEPANPRVLFVSSVGADLPSGMMVFQDLWDADIAGEAPESSPWNDWSGDWDDINIERVNLSTLFHRVAINNLEGNPVVGFRIDAKGNVSGEPESIPSGLVDTFFIDGSLVELCVDGAPMVKDIVRSDRSYYYNGFEWGTELGGETLPESADFSDYLCAEFRDWVDLYEISGDSIWMDIRQDRFDVLREFVECPELVEMQIVGAQEEGAVYSGIYSVLGIPVSIGGIDMYTVVSGMNMFASETMVGTYDPASQVARIYDIESNAIGLDIGGVYSGISLNSVVGMSSSGLDFGVGPNELIGSIEYYVDIIPGDGVVDDEGSFYFFNYASDPEVNSVSLVEDPSGDYYQVTLQGNNFHNVSEAPPALSEILGMSLRIVFDPPLEIL